LIEPPVRVSFALQLCGVLVTVSLPNPLAAEPAFGGFQARCAVGQAAALDRLRGWHAYSGSAELDPVECIDDPLESHYARVKAAADLLAVLQKPAWTVADRECFNECFPLANDLHDFRRVLDSFRYRVAALAGSVERQCSADAGVLLAVC
jgi:hypothetical protein